MGVKNLWGMMMGNDVDDDDEAKWNWRGSGVLVGRGSRGGVGEKWQ